MLYTLEMIAEGDDILSVNSAQNCSTHSEFMINRLNTALIDDGASHYLYICSKSTQEELMELTGDERITQFAHHLDSGLIQSKLPNEY